MKEADLAITERQFEQQIKDLAEVFGYLYYHTWRSIHSPAGFPDCVLVRRGRLIFAELKSKKGKVSPVQQEWLDELVACSGGSVEVYLWRPSMFEEIAKLLT